jgi:hypothetical protein
LSAAVTRNLAIEASAEVPPVPLPERVEPSAETAGHIMGLQTLGEALGKAAEIGLEFGEPHGPAAEPPAVHLHFDRLDVEVPAVASLDPEPAVLREGEERPMQVADVSCLVMKGEPIVRHISTLAPLEASHGVPDRFARRFGREGHDHVRHAEHVVSPLGAPKRPLFAALDRVKLRVPRDVRSPPKVLLRISVR